MLLTLAIFLPLLGMIVVLCLPKNQHGLIRWTSVAFSVARLTVASSTPSVFFNARSTLRTHPAQVIPVIGSSSFCVAMNYTLFFL